jgi:hypothetical protein
MPKNDGIGYDPKTGTTAADRTAAARETQKSQTPAAAPAPNAPSAPAPTPTSNTSNLPQTKQTLFPPDFAWFVNAEDKNVGVLQNPKIRVFVMGIEISPWITQINWNQDAKAEVVTSNSTVTIKSMRDLFMLTEENLFEDKWRDQVVDWRTSEAPKHKLFQYKTINNVYDLRTKVSRWNLNPNTCIFHNADTIRIFAKMPWTLEDCWQPVFTGYIEDPHVVRQQGTGEQTITFSAVTIADKLNRARVMNNFMAESMLAASTNAKTQVRLAGSGDNLFQSTNAYDSAELFNDTANPRQWHTFLFNTSIKSICEFIFYGDKIEDENETLSWDRANKAAATPEGQRMAKQKKLGELETQLAGLKSKLKFSESAYPPVKSGDDLVDQPRVRNIKAKIVDVDEQIKALKADLGKIDTANSTKDQALKTQSEKDKAAADAAEAAYANSRAAAIKQYGSWDKVPEADKQSIQKLYDAKENAAKLASTSGQAYSSTTAAGVIRKHGFGYLSPDLFIIEDFPYTGQVAPVDTTTAPKETTNNPQQTQAGQPKPDTTKNTPATTAPTTADPSSPLKKQWPVSTKEQSKGYGSFWYFRDKDGSGKPKQYHHTGIDVFASQGSTLYAPIDGFVKLIKIDWANTGGGGTYITYEGKDGYLHRFMHLSGIESGLAAGQPKTCGSVLGRTGGAKGAAGSGKSTTGAHLHWDIQTSKAGGTIETKSDGNGNFVNPNVWYGGTSLASSDPSTVTNEQKQAAEKAAQEARKARNANDEIDAEATLQDSYSSLDKTAEAAWMALWHARCLYGFANGTPPMGSAYGDFVTNDALITYRKEFGADPQDNTKALGLSDTIEDIDPEIFTPLELKKFTETRANAWLSEDEVTYIGVNSDWLGVYSPHGKSVAVAYKRPKAGFGISRGLDGPEVQNNVFDGTFVSRAGILSEFLQRIDYRWWITGNGDVVIDFPRYDLKPEDYGDWANYLMIEGEIWDDQFKENFSQLPSAYMIKGGWGGNVPPNANQEFQSVMQVVFQLPNALVRNGVQIKHISYPHVSNQEQLQMLGAVRINHDVANAIQIPMGNLAPILTITPNTPIYLFQQDAYAMVDNVKFQWNIGGDKINYNLSLETSAVRVRMTREQAYLEDLMDESEAAFKDSLKKLRAEQISNEDKIKKLDELKLNRGRVPEITPDSYQKWLGNKSVSGVPRYRHIQGKSTLIMDYKRVFTQNLSELGKYKTKSSQDVASPIMVSSPQVALANAQRDSPKTGNTNSVTFNSTEIRLGDGRDIEELLQDNTSIWQDGANAGVGAVTNPTNVSKTFTDARQCNESIAKGMSDVSKMNRIDPQTHQAMMAFANTSTNFQPNFSNYNLTGDKTSPNLGIFNMPPDIASQTQLPKGLSLPKWPL